MQITAKKEDEGKLIATLQSADAEAFDKDVACRQLAVVGTKQAVPALAALLEDEHLCDVARHALTQIPDPAADGALRAALGKVDGTRKVAVINSIGNRRDREAVAALASLLGDNDRQVATEAAASLAKIGGREAGMALTQALENAPEANRPAIADAMVTQGDTLMAREMHDIAVRVFDRVREANLPKHIRIAGMRGAILARQAGGVALLIEQLKSDDWGMFEVALRVIRELPAEINTSAIEAQAKSLPAEKQELLRRALADRSKAD